MDIPQEILDIAKRLHSQDNRATDAPIFVVQRRPPKSKRWEFVTACFTEDGCNDYLRRNEHNHRGEALRVYADSSYRNEEWRAVRAFLMGLVKP